MAAKDIGSPLRPCAETVYLSQQVLSALLLKLVSKDFTAVLCFPQFLLCFLYRLHCIGKALLQTLRLIRQLCILYFKIGYNLFFFPQCCNRSAVFLPQLLQPYSQIPHHGLVIDYRPVQLCILLCLLFLLRLRLTEHIRHGSYLVLKLGVQDLHLGFFIKKLHVLPDQRVRASLQ